MYIILIILTLSIFCVCESRISLLWIPMSEESKQIWYTPSELCILESSNKSLNLFENYQRCNSSNSPYFPFNSLGTATRKGWVGNVNSGWLGGVKDCFPPYNIRPHYKMELKGYSVSKIKNLTNVVKEHANHNRSIVFIGDSTQRQNYDAFVAEITRFSKHLKLLYYCPLKHQENIKYIPDQYKSVFDRLCKFNYTVVDCTLVLIDSIYTIIYFIWYGEEHTWNNGLNNINYIISKFDGTTIIANQGQWLHYKPNYKNHTKNVLQDLFLLKQNNPKKHIKLLWRETIAAHFNSNTGMVVAYITLAIITLISYS